MPYPVVHVKVNAEGHFGTSPTNIVEHWQAGFHITKNGGVIGGTSELTSFLTNIRTAVTTFHASATLNAGNICYLDALSGAYIGTDGKYALGPLQTTTRVALTTSTPGGGVSTNSWATAIVLTLRSALTRGPGSHGRIYWPSTGAAVQSTNGVLADVTVNSIAANASTMLNAINAVAATNWGTGTNIGLVSPKGSGFQSPVTRVGIGHKIDHMESRERDLPEAHVFAALTLARQIEEDLDDDFRRRMEELGRQGDDN
jgi:hypothetical protein